MFRWLTLALVVVVLVAAPVSAASITGQYVEARTCDVYTGPCFANADTGLSGCGYRARSGDRPDRLRCGATAEPRW